MPLGTTDLRRLRFFVELARDLHFGRSAERQHVSQPTLSQQIKRLEDELGVALFVRPAGTVTLTPAGARLLPQAEELLRHAAAFNALAAGLAREATTDPQAAAGRPAAGAYAPARRGNRKRRMGTAGG
jgi:DNA-binding transcriptional LysR family regulator